MQRCNRVCSACFPPFHSCLPHLSKFTAVRVGRAHSGPPGRALSSSVEGGQRRWRWYVEEKKKTESCRLVGSIYDQRTEDKEADEVVVGACGSERGERKCLFQRLERRKQAFEERLNECNLALGSSGRCMDEFWWDCEILSELNSPWKLKNIVLASECWMVCWSAAWFSSSESEKGSIVNCHFNIYFPVFVFIKLLRITFKSLFSNFNLGVKKSFNWVWLIKNHLSSDLVQLTTKCTSNY